MRIGVKLLLTYLLLIGFVALAAGLGVPRLVEQSVITAERERLQSQAEALSERLVVRIRQRAAESDTLRTPLALPEDLLMDETVAILDAKGAVIRTTRPELRGKIVPLPGLTARPAWLDQRRVLDLEGIGQVVWAVAPLKTGVSPEFQLLIIRSMPDIQKVSQPITRRLSLSIILGFLAALLVAGWLSREMVRRLRQVGATAQGLAEGDLQQRAPEAGADEITDLARHFNHMAGRIQVLVDGLRRSEQSRRELLMMVGHDLRTPLTSISGFAEALRDGVVQEESRKQRYYEIIATEAARLTRQVEDLFDMAKLEAGQLELRLQAMPVLPWLTEFADSIRPAAEAQGARIELRVTPEAARSRIYGDRDRLDQVLNNLAANALRFTPDGGTVTLRARLDGAAPVGEGPALLVEVIDQGPGLVPDEASRVFDRFYQGARQGRDHKGAGLGLAIVKSLVEAHGGQVGVTSTPGAGAIFWLRLNLA